MSGIFGDINKVTLMGNVTQDPDLRFTPSGSAVLNFSIATNRSYKAGDDWKDEVTFHNVVVWRNAEQLAKRIQKGTRLILEGRIQNRSWEDTKTGQTRYKTEVSADDVKLIARYKSGDGDSDGGNQEYSNSSSEEKSSGSSKKGGNEMIDPDDLPF